MSLKLFLIILGGMAVTFSMRFSFLMLSSKITISPKVTKFLDFIAPAVLTALITPAVFTTNGSINLSLSNIYLIAAFVSSITAFLSRQMVLTIISGISTVAVLTMFV